MKPQDVEAFGGILGAVMSYYDKDVPLPVAQIWFRALAEFELVDIQAALDHHVKNPDEGRFSPKVAHIGAYLRGGASARSLRAWTMVEKAIRCVGHYRSVCFDDAITNKVICDMGGWPKLCLAETVEDLKFRGIEFQKRYAGLVQTGGASEGYPSYLPGQIEAERIIGGFTFDAPMLIGDRAKALAVLNGGTNTKPLLVSPAPQTKLIEPPK
jgi:hypothetical protein